MVPVIYEDKDTDDDEESDDAMEDNTDEQQPEEQFHAARYIDANEDR